MQVTIVKDIRGGKTKHNTLETSNYQNKQKMGPNTKF